MSDSTLAQRAARLGVADRYHSFWGEDLQVPEAVLRRVLEAMRAGGEPAQGDGFPPVHTVRTGRPSHRIEWAAEGERPRHWQLWREGEASVLATGDVGVHEGRLAIELPGHLEPGYYRLQPEGWAAEHHCRLIVAPERCWAPQALLQGERWWGCTIQLYALKSSRNWGIGDFGDLRRLVDTAARQGASFIGLSPLHALFPHRPEVASPYSPSSRTALNPIYLDVQALVEMSGCKAAQERVDSEAFQERLRALRETELVDYPAVAAAKEEILWLLWRHFEARDLADNSSRAGHFRAYMKERDASIGRHALFEALQAHLHAQNPDVWGWPAWPEALRDPEGEAVAAFAREHASEVQFRFWLQWLAELQLESAQRFARTRGMGIGLYCDLAVGVNEGGAETWVQPQAYALGMHVGAPPDPLNALGQDWGLPPLNPSQLRHARLQPFIDTVRANMRHAGALRLDHVMSLMRLFWTGAEGGTYVNYPLQDLLGVLALESHRHECLVIGEDLGNVMPAMRQAMREQCLLSYRPLLFERADGGAFKRPADWQREALAVVSTHDLPTLRGFWLGEDIETQSRLDLYPDDDARGRQVVERAQDRARLLLALEQEGLLPEGASVQPTSVPDATPAFVDAVYALLARTPCWLLGVQLEDVTGQLLQVNVPGTTEDRFPNWRRKIAVPVEELGSDPRFASLAAVLRAERSGPAPGAQLALPPLESAQVPRATYRVQFHKECTFDQVAQAVPYLHALGISHLYSSPYLRARPGSTHGYDIVDHNALNPEVGDEAQHARLCATLRRHGMSQILDIVPNHMGVLEADNAWWLEVLEHGPAAAHAATFDIEWAPAAPEMAGRVLLPVLGDHYGKVLEAGELRLMFEPQTGQFVLRYWDHRFPIDPAHYPLVLQVLPMPPARDEGDDDSRAVVAALLDAFGRLPARDTPDDALRRARLRDAAVYQRSLARLAGRHEWLAHWIEACVQRLNSQAGDARSFDALDALIGRQAFRLADWRVASDDVNYRRFFDVNTLAAVAMEREEVFEATHRKVLHWLQDGLLSGLRIDHPDGLSDPQQYFERLQERFARQAQAAGREPAALYLAVEKIQAEHEPLPDTWPVHGDTGYRFGALVNGLLVDGGQAEAMTQAWQDFTGERESFDEVLYACKKLITATSLYSELRWLMTSLHRILSANRRTADFTRNRLRAALAEVAAAFPVYRTYLRADESPSARDRQHTEWALAAARRRLGPSESTLLDALRDVLYGEGEAAAAPQEERARFLARWQQFTAPVTAKAMEDTAFYRYLPLASLNEVGADPRSYGLSVAAFHAANQQRARHQPHSLLGTSTHDSKRAEDLRARMSVLSEDPALWKECVQRWAGWAELYHTETAAGPAPSRTDAWLLFQTLAGLWPTEAPGEAQLAQLRERIQAYMRKAVREAKRNTSWTCPNGEYEDALSRYIDAVLRPGPFLDELQKLTARIAPFGWRNSLAQLALKMTAPGVPDLYQGCESWSFSLVDPDNRRPVDFGALARQLDGLRELYAAGHPSEHDWQRLWHGAADGRIKQLLTWRLLALRARWDALFRDGSYVPLQAEGPAQEHAVGFARIHEGQAVVVVAARLAYGLCGGDDARWGPPLWAGTQLRIGNDALTLRRAGGWRNWLTGAAWDGFDAEGACELQALFEGAAGLPFAVLCGQEATP